MDTEVAKPPGEVGRGVSFQNATAANDPLNEPAAEGVGPRSDPGEVLVPPGGRWRSAGAGGADWCRTWEDAAPATRASGPSLADVLEGEVAEGYRLSRRAKDGILRRVTARRKVVEPVLALALSV